MNSIEELLAVIEIQKEQIAMLKNELAELKRLIYGSKSEKHKTTKASLSQGGLFDQEVENKEPIVGSTEQISYTRKKNQNHNGRNALPDHLPEEEVVIEPEEDTTDMEKIGEVVTETLKYTPASLVRLRRIRPKYACKSEDTGEKEIIIAPLPERPLPKSIAEPSLLSHLIVSKFIDHLPFYRQIQMFKRDFGWEPPKSTINDWFIAVSVLLTPLYERLKQKILESDYIQADESPIKVQDNIKKGKTHRGFQWVYHAPEKGIVLFHYHKSRSVQAPKDLLGDYEGYIQCDGYKVYDKLCFMSEGITLLGCWVHARRGFDKARDSDKVKAEQALNIFSKIYAHETKCKNYEAQQKKEYRQKHSLPLVKELKSWIDENANYVLPKSPIGKAMTYCINQWPKLMRAFEEGTFHIDNNLIENKIRPLALGRKNYLFAGSHKAAQRIAMMYSFFATCSIHNINPRDWLCQTIENISETKMSDIDHLLPQNFIKM